MPKIALKDILISARQESYQMRHFYLGVEHFFVALLEIKGGLVSAILQEQGLTAEYVTDAIRRKVGKGSKHRLWAGTPNTPRADIVLDIAHEIALEDSRKDICERDLLIAILDENDSIPIRVLEALGADIVKLTEDAHTHTLTQPPQYPFVKVDFGPDFDPNDTLSNDQLFILRRMFHGHDHIRIERRLTGGYTKATILIVSPNVDGWQDAAVVVKIDQTDIILDEARRYESHVKGTLPPLTARLEDKPIAPETSELAGIKYTLVAGSDQKPHDLRATVSQWDSSKLNEWLKKELFASFGRIWWQQRRPYRFQVWQEYDWVMPPLLTLEITQHKNLPANGHLLKFPIKRDKLNALEYGDIVAIENFVVQRVYPNRNAIQLAINHGNDSSRAFKIEVRDLDLTGDTYFRGEVLERVIGRVWKTRNETLTLAARGLDPDFDLEAEKIPAEIYKYDKLPNPLKTYEGLLDRYINGSLSRIHGDLHLGNIIVGPHESASLIDFAHTRDGHTIFDWATLEISLLSDVVMPAVGESWQDARQVLRHIANINTDPQAALQEAPEAVVEALSSIVTLRQIAQECLAIEGSWGEYFVALTFCSLRAITWETMPIGGRRLMFLLAALAIHELQGRYKPGMSVDDTSPDGTDTSE